MGWFWGKRFHFGSRTDDRITGSSRSDIVFGFGGDDEISTRGGRDRIFAGRGDDTIHAGTGNDFVAAGRGDDLIFDGAGLDTVTAGHGDDTVVFVARDNIGYHGRFDGGRGQDTLRLELTSQDWTADVREEVQAFLEFVAANTRIVSIAPSDDTDLVNLDRKISVRFDRLVDPRTITSDSFQILAPDGAQIEGALRLSSDGLKASFFLAEGSLLPASSTVRILIDGTQILDTAGQPVDADGDGIAGGTRITDFETVSVTPVPDTNIEGFIFDSNRRGPDGEDIPLEGVVVSVVGLPGVFAVTDATGRFFLEDLPVPDAFLEFDATAVEAASGFRYGTVTKPVHTIAGQTTQMALTDGTPFNIYLASLSTSDAVPISAGGETTVGLGADGLANLAALFPEVDPAQWENLTVTIPENSLFFDDGTPATEATILAFQPDRIPAPLPQGHDPDFVFTLVAGGAENFDSNAQVTFPNLDGLPPGARRPILSFDHDAGEWPRRPVGQ
jgi:hypothetical protein